MSDEARPHAPRRDGRKMSWRAIADALAERLVLNEPCRAHDAEQPDDCPFCADAEAMRLYREKGGTARAWEPPADATQVDVAELMRRHQGDQ